MAVMPDVMTTHPNPVMVMVVINDRMGFGGGGCNTTDAEQGGKEEGELMFHRGAAG